MKTKFGLHGGQVTDSRAAKRGGLCTLRASLSGCLRCLGLLVVRCSLVFSRFTVFLRLASGSSSSESSSSSSLSGSGAFLFLAGFSACGMACKGQATTKDKRCLSSGVHILALIWLQLLLFFIDSFASRTPSIGSSQHSFNRKCTMMAQQSISTVSTGRS